MAENPSSSGGSSAEVSPDVGRGSGMNRLENSPGASFEQPSSEVHLDSRPQTINANGEILLVKQWRRAAQQILIELPAGTLEKDEDPLFCADRELREETGMRAKNITFLTGFYSAPGILSEYLYLYLAEKLTPDPLIGEDTDDIDQLTVSIDKATQMIQSG